MENRAKRQGVVRAMALSDHWRCVSTPRWVRTSANEALLHRSADWPRERPGIVRQPLPLTWDALCRSKPMPTVATASPGKGSRSRTGATTMPACAGAGA